MRRRPGRTSQANSGPRPGRVSQRGAVRARRRRRPGRARV